MPGRKTNSSTFCRENTLNKTLTLRRYSIHLFDVLSERKLFRSAFHDIEAAARLDYKLSPHSQLFYRFTYDNASDVNSFGGNNFQPLKSRDTTYGNAFGFDLTRGAYIHSIRFAYDRYSNHIDDAVGWKRQVFSIPAPGTQLEFHRRLGLRQRPQPAGAATHHAGQ